MKAVAIATVDDAALAARLRGLPLLDPTELEDATGFVWTVRSFVTLPLTTLGALATVAALLMGSFVSAAIASGVTALIVWSLYQDTQLSKAVEHLRRGELAAADASLRRIADADHRSDPQRQRARAYLAGVAWVRGDLEAALQWTRAWLEVARKGRERPFDELCLTLASEVQLLALLGEHTLAAEALAKLPVMPRGERFALADATCRLLLAFSRDDAEPVRASLDGWTTLIDGADDHGLPTTALAWAYDALGLPERTIDLVHRARTLTKDTAFRNQAPALAQWLATYDPRVVRYR